MKDWDNEPHIPLINFVELHVATKKESNKLEDVINAEQVLPGRWENGDHINNIPNSDFVELKELEATFLEL